MSNTIIPVGLGEVKVSLRGQTTLVCYGLGSCIGVALSDPRSGVCSLSHVVLPESNLTRTSDFPPGKFADTAIQAAVKEMERLGAVGKRLEARIVGGAKVLRGFAFQSERLDIGTRNIEAVKAALAAHSINIVAEDVGGCHGRTMQLFADSGKVIVSAVGAGERELC